MFSAAISMLYGLTIALLCLIHTGLAINCYRGAVYNNSAAPTEQLACPVATYCTKITALIPVSLATYGCDQSASLCKAVECYDNQNGGKTCCCATDFCNESNIHLSNSVIIMSVLFYVLF
ncbi:hypothetical protein Y032_0906g2971 [Ancylostoma ceylanicum]|nr:hypothetical protein Y032_0906g2971 [Ancylostoma ceylanicum]